MEKQCLYFFLTTDEAICRANLATAPFILIGRSESVRESILNVHNSYAKSFTIRDKKKKDSK
jgi:hypothetical protein